MKKFLLLCGWFVFGFFFLYGQGDRCSNPVLILNNSTLTNQTLPGQMFGGGGCVPGRQPALFIKFRAGNCSQFIIKASENISAVNTALFNSNCNYIPGSLECHRNVIQNIPFTKSGINAAGENLLLPGREYILAIWGPATEVFFDIAFESNAAEKPDNNCLNAVPLNNGTQRFFNGGDCYYSGTYDNNLSPQLEPPANTVCGTTLENSQWITFSPEPGVNSFMIAGSNFNCTGGGCGFQAGLFTGDCNNNLYFLGCYARKVCPGGGPLRVGPQKIFHALYRIDWLSWSETGFLLTVTHKTGTFDGTEKFYILIDGNADADCSYELTGLNLKPLPVKVINFSGKYFKTKKLIRLEWEIPVPEGIEKFIIKKSVDGNNWTEIYETEDVNKRFFVFDDYFLKEPVYYYRLFVQTKGGQPEPAKTIAVVTGINHENIKVLKRYNIYGNEITEQEFIYYKGLVIELLESGEKRKIIKW